jgi:uncharacterized protein (TIGR02996 family)
VTDHKGFLADVLAHPDLDWPRLVYADWLEEHGEGARAEFIRVQCELAGRDCHHARDVPPQPWCRPCALRHRERELLEQSQFSWLPRCLMDVESLYADAVCSYRRGFVSEITLDCHDFMEHAAALFAAAPITEVRLSDREPGDYTGDVDGTYARPFSWWAYPHTYSPSYVGKVWEFLTGRIDRGNPSAKDYKTRADALADLSRACVTHGRLVAAAPPRPPAVEPPPRPPPPGALWPDTTSFDEKDPWPLP